MGIFLHNYLATMAVLGSLRFNEHSDEAVFIREVPVRELDFIVPVVFLMVEDVL